MVYLCVALLLLYAAYIRERNGRMGINRLDAMILSVTSPAPNFTSNVEASKPQSWRLGPFQANFRLETLLSTPEAITPGMSLRPSYGHRDTLGLRVQCGFQLFKRFERLKFGFFSAPRRSSSDLSNSLNDSIPEYSRYRYRHKLYSSGLTTYKGVARIYGRNYR